MPGSDKTIYLEEAILDHVLGGTSFTQPTDIYLALFTAAPDEEGGGTEVDGGDYARQVVSFGPASDSTATNDSAISFTNMPAVTIVATALMDDDTAGNMLYYDVLGSGVSVSAGETVTVDSGDITVEED